MPKVYIKRNFQIWPKTKLSSVQSTVPPTMLLGHLSRFWCEGDMETYGWFHIGGLFVFVFVPNSHHLYIDRSPPCVDELVLLVSGRWGQDGHGVEMPRQIADSTLFPPTTRGRRHGVLVLWPDNSLFPWEEAEPEQQEKFAIQSTAILHIYIWFHREQAVTNNKTT